MQRLEEYAQLIVEVGLNVQKDENVVIVSQVEDPRLARLVAKKSYEKGAREVHVTFDDDFLTKQKFLHASDDVFEKFPEWIVKRYEHLNSHNTNYLSIVSQDPEALKGVDPNRLANYSRLSNEALQEHVTKVMGNEQCWCVVAIPGEAWAKKVFPDLTPEAAVSKMWDVIFDIVRVGNNQAVPRWKAHVEQMSHHNKLMNNYNFKSLRFTSKNGTDLTVGLVANHIWCGGSEDNIVTGVEFVANMPTEECFTMPDANNVNGVVYNTKPLSYQGNLIDGFMLEFKDGKVVNFSAEVGHDVLKTLLETDEGASRIGEVALVPYDSPISNTNILFYNTLFDENASCHLALGRAYPINVKDCAKYSKEELAKIGVNTSVVHVDFMIGDSDTNIVGETQDGQLVDVFKDGNFVI